MIPRTLLSISAMHRKKRISCLVVCFYLPSVKNYLALVSDDKGMCRASTEGFPGLVSRSKELEQNREFVKERYMSKGESGWSRESVAQIIPPYRELGLIHHRTQAFGGICMMWAFWYNCIV